MREAVLAVAACSLAVTAPAPAPPTSPATERADSRTAPALLTLSQQMDERDEWLAKRHQMLLGMMRRHRLDWWIAGRRALPSAPSTRQPDPIGLALRRHRAREREPPVHPGPELPRLAILARPGRTVSEPLESETHAVSRPGVP